MAYAINNDSQSYDNAQYNTQGESLSPTPPANGAPISVDHSNDNRTAADFKSDAQQVNKDLADLIGNDGHTSAAGNSYSKMPSRKDMIIDGVIGIGMAYLSGGDEGQQLKAAVSAAYKAESKAKRYTKIDELERKGYNPVDIEKWLDTGDGKDLLTNKGKWEDNHDGSQTNSLTGERRIVELSPLQVQNQANFESQQAAQQQQREQAQANADRSYNLQVQQNELQNKRYDLEDKRYQANLNAQTAKATVAKQEKETTRQDNITSSLDALDNVDRTTKDLLSNPSLDNIYGYTGSLPTMTNESRRAEAMRDQLSSQQFLQQRQQLKGAGAITDFEGQKAERAASVATNPDADPATVRQALYQIVDINALGRARLEARKKDPNAPLIQAAPDAALEHLRQNPDELGAAFKAKYGYLPVYR